MGKRFGKLSFLGMGLAVLALLAGSAEASQFRAFSREAQVRGSDLIALGRVVSVHSEWDGAHSSIHTDAEIALDDVWKGDPASDRIVVRNLGGEVGNVSLEVEGSATFTVGEHVLVFLRSADGAYLPWGMRFGKYEVVEEGGSSFAVGALPPTVFGAQHFAQVSVPLDDLRAEVMSLIAGEVK
jgi:hypothetical protein